MAEKWISVKKRLPRIDRPVMVCIKSYGGKPIYAWGARVDEGDCWLWGRGGRFGIDPKQNASWNDIEADDDYQVTHWRPLPRAPFKAPASSSGSDHA